MPLTSQPTQTDAAINPATGIGRAKSDDPSIPLITLDYQVPAAEWGNIQLFLIAVCGEVGNHAGAVGTLNARIAAVEAAYVPSSRNMIAGPGLTGGGTQAADRTFAVGANADNSIVVNPDDIQVGVLATDAQHGNRGGGGIHSAVVAAGASGFMTGVDKTKLDGIEAAADVTDAANVATAGAVMDVDFAGTHAGSMLRTGVGTYAARRDNATASNPTVTDDSASNYAVGSRWVNTSTGDVYYAASVGVGAADWRKIPRSASVRAVSSDVTISVNDRILNVDTSGGNRILTLPSPALMNEPFIVKKTTTDTNTISLARFASEMIETVAGTVALSGSAGTGRPSYTAWSDGTNWWYTP